MNKMQEEYINVLATSKAEALKKDSTDGTIFEMTRSVANEVVEAGIVLEKDTQLKIYNALVVHRKSLIKGKK